MEHITVTPKKVRATGDVLSSFLSGNLILNDADVNMVRKEVNGVSRDIFEMFVASNTNLVLSAYSDDYPEVTLSDGTLWIPYVEDGGFMVTARLSDNNNNPLANYVILFDKSKPTGRPDTIMVGQDGTGETWFPIGGIVEYNIEAVFFGDRDVTPVLNSCISNLLHVVTGGCDINLIANKTDLGYKEEVTLSATVYNSICESYMPDGTEVSFYTEGILLGKANTVNGIATFRTALSKSENVTAKIGEETSESLSLNVAQPVITLTPSKTTEYKGNSVDVLITVMDGKGSPVVGETVYFFRGSGLYESIGATNSNGEISSTVTGTAAKTYYPYAGIDGYQTEKVPIKFILPPVTQMPFDDNTTVIQLYNNTNYYTYKGNGVARLKGALINNSFENTDKWEMSFAYSYPEGMRYTGLIVLADLNDNTKRLTSWEGGQILGLPGDLPEGTKITDNPAVQEYNVLHVKKTSPTTLELWKNNDTANKVTYTWNDLASITNLTIGAMTNSVQSQQYGSVYLKDWQVSYL